MTESVCKHLKPFFDREIETDNLVTEVSTGWRKIKLLVEFKLPPNTVNVKNAKEKKPPIKYWEYAGSPQDKPDCGIKCEKCLVALKFPLGA